MPGRESSFGRSQAGGGRRVQVEFVSANPTGPLTVGHGRGAVFGDTVARLLEWTGHEVEREYYFNNAGRQMRILGDSVRLRYLELLGDSVAFPEDYYQGEYIRDIARHLVDAARRDGCGRSPPTGSFKEQAETGDLCGHQEDAEIAGHRVRLVLQRKLALRSRGRSARSSTSSARKDLVYDKEGAVWFRTSALGNWKRTR